MIQNEFNYKSIYQSMVQAHRRKYFIRILKSVLIFTNLSIAFLLTWTGLNVLFDVSVTVRITALSLLFLWIVGFTILRILPLLREILVPSEHQLFHTAGTVGNSHPAVRDAILNYLQLYNDKGSRGSPIIKRLALGQLSQRISHIPIKDGLEKKTVIPYFRWFTVALSICLIIIILVPSRVNLAVKKLVYPWKNYRQPFPITLLNESGNVQVLKNDPVKLVCSARGVKPDKLYLVVEEFSDKVNNPQSNRIELPVSLSGRYEYELPHVSTSFYYFFAAELNHARYRNRRALSEKSLVEVQERPVIRSLQVTVKPPAYTGLAVTMLPPNDGEITAYHGSEVNVSIQADKQLSSARLIFADSSVSDLSIAGHTAKATFRVTKNSSYSVVIFDTDSISNSEPIVYGIYMLIDDHPYAEIKQPGADVDLQDELVLPMIIDIRDDFGFSGLWVKGAVFRQGVTGDSTSFEMKVPFEIFEKGKAISDFSWDLTSFYMVPDDYLQYYAEVFDNDRINGPKSFKTAVFTARLPSLLEILTRSEEQQQQQLDKIRDISRDSKEVREKLEEINRELRKESKVDWERQQDIKKQLSNQKDINEKLEEIQHELDQMIKDMDNRDVLSPEALQKYLELQEMFQELAPPELKNAMEQLEQALEKADKNQIQKALENFRFSAEQFEKNIDRFHELFKKVQLEQKMDELIKLAEKLNQEQTRINEKLEDRKIKQEDFQRLEKKEENIGKNNDYLSEKIDETARKYQDIMKEFSEMLEKTKSFIDEQALEDMIRNMQQQLAENQQLNALSSGQKLKSSFEMMQSMLQMARNNMVQQQKEQVADAMQKTMQDMLQTSFNQENLAQRSRRVSPASPQINDIARQQARLMSNTNRIIEQLMEIADQTFFMSPELNQHMAETMSNMNNAIQQLENRNVQQAATAQSQAMAGFNKALLSLQSSMDKMEQSNSSSGFQEFMEQMQQLSGQQGQLNQESMSLFQQNREGRGQLSEEALARLAAQQQMIRNSMQQLSDNMGSRRDVLGRLGDLGGEMEDVIKELKTKNLDRKVIERQEKILSRMLDAQKSIREKEYSKKREAEREEIQLVKSPPQIKKELLQKEDRLRRELRDAMEEGYSQEYKEFIKNYFEFLSRHPEILQ